MLSWVSLQRSPRTGFSVCNERDQLSLSTSRSAPAKDLGIDEEDVVVHEELQLMQHRNQVDSVVELERYDREIKMCQSELVQGQRQLRNICQTAALRAVAQRTS